MHIAVTGSSGLLGSTLLPLLASEDHRITRVVRRQAGKGEVAWDPAAGILDAEALSGVDAVVHLAGENIASSRWTRLHKDRVRNSRVLGTQLLCQALARCPSPPRTFVSASAVGLYGDRGDELLDEGSPAGQGYLPETVAAWEAAAQRAEAVGVRVVCLRFGIVLSAAGGALAKMLLPFRLGVGGTVGNGRQYWSWISEEDAVGAIRHALLTSDLAGPVNAVAPNPARNAEFTRTLGRVLRRPTWVPLPAFAARLALGEMADQLLLASTRAVPRRLLESGFAFRYPDLEGALRRALGRIIHEDSPQRHEGHREETTSVESKASGHSPQ